MSDRNLYVLGGALGALILREAFSCWRNRDNEKKSRSTPTIASGEANTTVTDSVTETSSLLGTEHPYTRLREKYGDCVYMDYNATTPVWPEVTAAMEPFSSTCFGNPSSPHVFAAPCQAAMTAGRSHVSRLVNAPSPSDIIFTSCGSEADNRAIDIALACFRRAHPSSSSLRPHVISTVIEHPAILEYLSFLAEEQKIDVTLLPVNSEGFVTVSAVEEALRPDTALVTVMHSNNEVGTLQPIRLIGAAIQQHNATSGRRVLFHSDGAQSLGKVLIDVQRENIDLLTIVGHKFGAPKGVGALFVREGIPVNPLIYGGGQEGGRRAGTENVMLAAALGEASRIARVEAVAMMQHLLRLKLLFVTALHTAFDASQGKDFFRFNGPAKAYEVDHLERSIAAFEKLASYDTEAYFASTYFPTMLPNTVSVGFRGVLAAELITLLRTKLACSAGTTCHACHEENSLSAVLAAMQVAPSHGLGTLRLSFGRHTTSQQVQTAVAHLASAVTSLVRKTK